MDAGNIICKKKLPLSNISDLYKLRALNTKICCELVNDLLDQIKKDGLISQYKQKKIGRYYSAMPSSLKSDCIKKFKIYKNYEN